jgi:hypothetical protein
MNRGALATTLIIGGLVAGGCGILPGGSPSPSVEPTSSASPTPTPLPTVAPTPTPTPEPGSVPIFTPGQVVAANADGLRVRSLPSTSSRILIPLSLGTEVVIVLGPIPAENFGWYLVADPAAAEPQIPEGWVAAGVTPEPYLVETDTPPLDELFVAGWSHAGDAEYGPVRVEDEHYALHWVAAPTAQTTGCSFSVDLRAGSGTPVQTIRTTVGSQPTPGSLYEDFFAAHPELRGDLFFVFVTDCSWALSVERIPGIT